MLAPLRQAINARYQRWLERRIPRERQVTLDQRRIFIFPGPRGAMFAGVLVLLFLGGINARLFAVLFLFLALAFVVLIWTSPYRRERIFGFMDPWSDAFGKGYQLSHALIAFGRGEWFGVGLGGSVEKLFYLPEAHTDFLLAVIAEELGLAGVLAVIVLFALIVQRAFAIGRQSLLLERAYGGLVAQGIGI